MIFMNLKSIEITALVIIAVALIISFSFQKTIKTENKNIYCVIMTIAAMIEAFIVIHFLFCYQIGFPASVTQDNSRDLSLSSADWLGFLSGYLGFSGSLIMAFLVYRQSGIINNFTLSEYRISASIVIRENIKSIDYSIQDNFRLTNIIQHMPGNKKDEYYSYHCVTQIKDDCIYEQFNVLIFVGIVNNSKMTISNLSFKSLEITDVNEGSNILIYENRSGDYDPADGYTDIFPGRILKRCFLIENIPETINISWMTFHFTYDHGAEFKPRVLVSKTKGNSLYLINVSEQIA